jgi:hypothetical protein
LSSGGGIARDMVNAMPEYLPDHSQETTALNPIGNLHHAN